MFSLLFKPRFLLASLYVMCYVTIRVSGDIVSQSVEMRGVDAVTQEVIVGSSPTLPHWRRQLYRVFFSPLMVAEEEGRRAVSNNGGIVSSVRKAVNKVWSD